PNVIAAVSTVLGTLRHRSVADELLRLADSAEGKRETDLRGRAVEVLGLMRWRPACPKLLKMLGTEPDAEVRGKIASTLRIMGYRPAVKLLLRLVASNPDSKLQRELIDAVAALGDPKAIPELIPHYSTLTSKGRMNVAARIVRATGILRGPETK